MMDIEEKKRILKKFIDDAEKPSEALGKLFRLKLKYIVYDALVEFNLYGHQLLKEGKEKITDEEVKFFVDYYIEQTFFENMNDIVNKPEDE